jgi:hypothetical protein
MIPGKDIMRNICCWLAGLCFFAGMGSPRISFGSGELIPASDLGCYGAGPANVNFTPTRYTYVFSGSCYLLQTRLNLPVTVPWTGVGNYDPTTGQSSEDIIVPAPRIDQPSRPYGRFLASMHCSADPWLNPNMKCDHISPSIDAPLDNTAPNAIGWKQAFPLGPVITGTIMQTGRPYTSTMSQDAVNNLNRQYGAFQAKNEADMAARRLNQKLTAPALQQQALINQTVSPFILSPAAGQRFIAQRAIPIKLAPPQGWSVTSYLVHIERRDANGNWVVQTNIPVAASDAQSPIGYIGFGAGGAGNAAVYYSAPGAWRVSAQTASPKQSAWSNFVEFTVAAPIPLTTPGVLRSK